MKIKLTKMFVFVLSLVLPLLAACTDEPAEGDETSSNSSLAPVTSSQSTNGSIHNADPIEELTEKVNQAPNGNEDFGLHMLYSQLSYIASGETETPYTGFASPNEISSSALYNFFLAIVQDDADKYLSASDSKYHIPIEAIKNTLDSYFSGYTFDPKQIVREPEGTCTYSEEAREIIDSSFVGYGGPAWIEFDNAETQTNGEIIVSAHGIDMDGNAVDRTETITVILTATGYQFKSYQIINIDSVSQGDDVVSQANNAKEEIMAAIQNTLQAYQAGTVENNELEPRFDAFPENGDYPIVGSVDDFQIEKSSNDMFAIKVSLDAGKYTMDFFLSPMGPSIEDIANGAKEDDVLWKVNAVSIQTE